MPPDANVKPDADSMDDDGELTVEALDRVVGGAVTANVTSKGPNTNSTWNRGGGPMNYAAP
jgi:hypothetical protein